jgi:hypothetical protein
MESLCCPSLVLPDVLAMTRSAVFSGQMRTLMVLAAALLVTVTVKAQTCPPQDQEHGLAEASRPSVLHGTLLVHDELRQWLGIKLDRPACGQKEVELVYSKAEGWRKAEALRGCTLTATGKLYDSPTGYYSADIAISDPILKPDPSCHAFPVKPDPYAVPIPPGVTEYQVSITVDYRSKGHIDVRVRQSDDKRVLLKPWQAYVNNTLTGSMDVIWFDCPNDFRIQGISQTPENPNGMFDDEPTGTVLQDLKGSNVIKFSCKKESELTPN